MKTWHRVTLYTLLRLGLFAAVLTVLLLLNIDQWLAALLAAVITLALSYLLLRGPREALAQDLEQRRLTPSDPDSAEEDAAASGLTDSGTAASDEGPDAR